MNPWKQIAYFIVFFSVAPITLFASILTLSSTAKASSYQPEVLSAEATQTDPLQPGVQLFASLPDTKAEIDSQIEVKDARVEIVKKYLNRYDSPLLPYAEKIVKTADLHKIDFRLITAIAQQESNLCKKIPPNSYNCWGWGIHSRGTLGFSSFEEGIEVVSAGLKENYLAQGFESVEEIMSKYTPLSNGSWAEGVTLFMSQME